MTKMPNALGYAPTETVQRDIRPAAVPSPVARIGVRPTGQATVSPWDMQDEMARLYQQVDLLLPDGGRVLQFVGSQDGEGTSTIVRAFGRVAATRFGQRVLLLLEMGSCVSGVAAIGSNLAIVPSRVGQSSLHVASLPQDIATASRSLERAPDTIGLWGPLRDSFDVIVIDARPVGSSPESLTIAGQVDGVVLVLAAENTSIRLARQTRDRIERSGGRLLGMVFNKQRQHLPGFIEQRLG